MALGGGGSRGVPGRLQSAPPSSRQDSWVEVDDKVERGERRAELVQTGAE